MATLADVRRLGREVVGDIKLFGAKAEFLEEHQRRFRAIGDAIRKEQQITEGAPVLPSDGTILGKEAEARFEEWAAFIRRNGATET